MAHKQMCLLAGFWVLPVRESAKKAPHSCVYFRISTLPKGCCSALRAFVSLKIRYINSLVLISLISLTVRV